MTKHPRFLAVPALVLWSLSGCSDDAPLETRTNFWEDVAPIYFDSCVGCHREDGVAPFRLDTYEAASAWADASVAAVTARTMPPWLMDSDGSCGEFRGSRALTDDEIAKISAWVADGVEEGPVRTDLVPAAPPVLTEGLDLITPVFMPEIEGGPLAEFDEYRCFLLEPGLAKDMFITGYDVTPGNPEIVHHILAIPVDPEGPSYIDGVTNMEVIEGLQAGSPDRDGWPCFGAAGDGVRVEQIPVTWAPGMGAVEYPPGTGVRLDKDDVVVVQVHYNLHDHGSHSHTASTGPGGTTLRHGGELSDSSQVRLRLADAVDREGYFVIADMFLDTLFFGEPATITPGQASAPYQWTFDLKWLLDEVGVDSADLYGIYPHMHERGQTWRAELLNPETPNQCLGNVQRWDFGWQLYYFYQAPIRVTNTSQLQVTCNYDTLDLVDPVLPGWGTNNEMCLAGMFLVP